MDASSHMPPDHRRTTERLGESPCRRTRAPEQDHLADKGRLSSKPQFQLRAGFWSSRCRGSTAELVAGNSAFGCKCMWLGSHLSGEWFDKPKVRAMRRAAVGWATNRAL